MSTSDRAKILLVDDQPQRLLSYEAILEELGQELVKVTSGTSALERLMREEFAVILLDVSMPVMDGFETAALIREHPRFEKTPIIFVTALHITDFDRMRGYELGAVDYVFVPVVPQILRSKVSVLVELFHQRRELERLNERLRIANAELAEANSTLLAEKARELERLNQHLRESRERLEEADRRKDEFLAMLAHELRNPLAPMRSGLELLRKESRDAERLGYLEMIDRQAGNLTRLVDDLMDVSRITQGKMKVQAQPVEVSTVVVAAVETCQPLIEARRHTLTVDLPDDAIWVTADSTRMAQVIGNLLNNAAKYTDDGGRIRLSVEASRGGGDDPGKVSIRVKDNGVGLSPEVIPQLFELFSQVESTRERAQGGLGVGLALVSRIVAMHGGTVSAHSDGPGKGSEFVVTLPLHRDPAPRVPVPRPAAERRKISRRILVVDDNVDAAMSLAILLQQIGNDVRTAHDGPSCLQTAGAFRPEVVLLDIGMPKMNGYEVARRMRSEPDGGDVLLIALTGWGQEDVRTRVREAGFDAHLIKPVELVAITDLLATLADDSRRGLRGATAGNGDRRPGTIL